MATETRIQKALYLIHQAYDQLVEARGEQTTPALQVAIAAVSTAALGLEIHRAEPRQPMTFARLTGDTPWVMGGFEADGFKYRYEAKVYDTPSEYGIGGGRVSFLHVKDGNRDVAWYDRGWGPEGPPSNWRYQQVLASVVKALESIP